ncbi:hypothetical protein ACFL0M_10580, partial [Thermodesulfobacteriota bacterium]
EFELVPKQYLSLQADASWSKYESEFISHNMAFSISDKRGDKLFVEHRYTQGSIKSIYTDFLLNITNSLSAYVDYERNIFEGNRIRTGLGGLYKAQCWSLDLRYVDEAGVDRRFEFTIRLYGLGELGTDLVGRKVERPFEKAD